jgi:pyruvate formate lyase activating enzyme
LLTYGKVVAANVDPIEKKPLYHFYPGRPILSVGTFGCNLRCRFCQNSDLSQAEQPTTYLSADTLCQRAFHLPDNLGIAFTYNEPGIWFEYVIDAARLLREASLKTVMVTNGYLCAEPFTRLCRQVDAMNIDLKAFNETFYKEECRGGLEAVKRNIEIAVRSGIHVELTNLVVTGLNDNEAEFGRMIDWIASLGKDIPLHISRYFPRYLETAPATDPATIKRFVDLAGKKLSFVYAGNLAGQQNTYCPQCNALLIERKGYSTRLHITSEQCDCGYRLKNMIQAVK